MIINSPLNSWLILHLFLLHLIDNLSQTIVVEFQPLNVRIQEIDFVVSLINLINIEYSIFFELRNSIS